MVSIAISTNTLDAGGAENQRVILANELVSQGHRVTIYCLQSDSGFLREKVDPKVSISKVAFTSLVPKVDNLICGTTQTESVFGLANKVAGRVDRWTIAIHNPIGPGAPRLKLLPVLCLAWCDISIALTPAHHQWVRSYWGVSTSAVISNAIDSARFGAYRADGQSVEFDVGYLGRLSSAHKGLDRLLEGFARVKDLGLRLGVAGEGPDRKSLQKQAIDLGIDSRVTWLGSTDSAAFLGRIGCLALLSRWEGQPLVLLEAAAVGVPVVASKFAGADPNFATLVDADDPEEVAAALVENRNGVRKISTSAWTVQDMALAYLALSERPTVKAREKLRHMADVLRMRTRRNNGR
ncbi:MAG: glycosyltransferase [Rhodoglobus sp.]